MHTTRVRRAFLAISSAALVAACSGTTASPSAAPSTAPSVAAASTAPSTAPAPSAAPVTLTYLVDDSQNTKDTAQALTDAYTALHPNVTFTIETRPGGTDGDNIIKTRLATGDMDDIFWYNSGSLLQALKPADTIVDISGEPFIPNIDPTFITTVQQGKAIFGVPSGTALGGGILYNKKVFAQVGITPPKTWAEFESNNDKLKAAGIAPVGATFGDTWTSQLFVLADFYNVNQAEPGFVADYTANKAKYATTPAAMAGFKYLQEAHDKGWYQKGYQTLKFEPGLAQLADGKFAQYPQLSFVLSTIATNSPDKIDDIGFFAMPGTDAAKNGATIWMPAATYIAKTSKNIDAAKGFLAFIASTAGVDAINAKVPPQGPYVIKGSKLPDNTMGAVKDISAYIEAGNAGPALEFLSPVKGPNLEQICVAVGSGQEDAAKGAADYDKDVEKEAKQLGLPGW